MLSKIPQEYLKLLSVHDLETLLEAKRRDEELSQLMEKRDRLTRELERVNERIEAIESKRHRETSRQTSGPISVRKRKTLKEHIIEVMKEAGQPATASDIHKRLIDRGIMGRGNNPRSFYNTVFQALQRYDIFVKNGKYYSLSTEHKAAGDGNANLRDFVVGVLKHSNGPLKASEIASRVLIAGYQTELDQDGLTQRVSALLKKHLKDLFDWDSQRYRLKNV